MKTTALRQTQGPFSIWAIGRADIGGQLGIVPGRIGAASLICELSFGIGSGAIRAQLGSDLRISHRRRNGCATCLWPTATTEKGKRIIDVYLQSAGISDSLRLCIGRQGAQSSRG